MGAPRLRGYTRPGKRVFLWVQITCGGYAQPADAIRQRFNAAFVVSDLRHTAFLQQARADPRFKEVYRDQLSVVLQIVE